MKKKIRILSAKMSILEEKKDGTLEGGFASIRGGYGSLLSTNTGCSNTTDCSHSTNTMDCTNTGTCPKP